MAHEDEEIAEEWISDIVKAIGKHSKELGDLADRLVTRWNEFSTSREAHRVKMAELQSTNMARFLRYGIGLIALFVVIASTLVYLRIVGGEALLFFMGTVIGYLFAYFGRTSPPG